MKQMINVFPQPFFAEQTEEEFVFGQKVFFVLDEDFSDDAFLKIAVGLWNNFTSGKSHLEVLKRKGMGKSAIICVCETQSGRQSFSGEYEYTVECSDKGIFIDFSCEKGLVHAFFTVLQLIGAYRRLSGDFRIGGIFIKDKPALGFRAMHICVFPETSLTFLKKTVRLLALLKCTHIVIEFFGMIRPECFPYFGWQNAFTSEELSPIIADGIAMGVEFIPMFNHFGHAGGSRFKAGKNAILDQASEFEELFEPGGWTWNVRNPEVLRLHENLRHELCKLFGKGEYFHMGCDEVYAKDPRIDPYDRQDNDTFIDFVNKSAQSICRMGRTPLMWGDMFLNEKNFPRPYCHNASHRCYDSERNLGMLDENVVIADWQYDIDKTRAESVEYFVKAKGKDKLILCPWSGYDNIEGRCELAKKYSLHGVLGTTWYELQVEPKFMVFTACLMWESEQAKTSEDMWELIKVFAAQNIRKLVPSGGIYEDAGFVERELIYKPL